jgi:hypothetical protein
MTTSAFVPFDSLSRCSSNQVKEMRCSSNQVKEIEHDGKATMKNLAGRESGERWTCRTQRILIELGCSCALGVYSSLRRIAKASSLCERSPTCHGSL